MLYNNEIIRVLAEAGDDGLPVDKISRHVFNACNSLFHPIALQATHLYIKNYLQRSSKQPHSMIERTKKGYYRLNIQNEDSRQLFLNFSDNIDNDVTQRNLKDESLSLFDD